MNNKQPRFPHKYLILGIFLLLIGSLLLLWQLGFLPSLGNLRSIPFLLIGLFILYLVIIKGMSPKYLLAGMFITLISTFFLLLDTVLPIKSLSKIWPVFMFITGISILPYSFFKKTRRARIAIITPALTIILLSIFFFMFSLGILNDSFIDVALTWWPILIVITGSSFILYYFTKNFEKTNNK